MRWSERQRAMLREMGIPAFWPDEPAAPEAVVPAVMAEPVATQAASVLQAAQRASEVVNRAAERAAEHPAPTSAPTAASPAARPAPSAPSKAAPTVALGPRPEGIDTMDWPALRAAVAGCQACALCSSRSQTVFGVGHEQADWMIVGEAPGEQEDLEGEPFVGRSGQLLDRMLQAVQLTRQPAEAAGQVYIANTLKCRPPANRNPLPQEMAQCEPFLLRQIALVKPKVILAMGRFAVQSLLKTSEPIGKLRGRVHEVEGVPVVVTYHPAYLLRNPVDKALAWDDLCRARELVQSPR